jgi:hypothetical protein
MRSPPTAPTSRRANGLDPATSRKVIAAMLADQPLELRGTGT